MLNRIGVDIGGTWLRAGMIEGNANEGRVNRFEKLRTPADWDHFVEVLLPFVESAEGFGVAVSGPIADHARVIKGPNIPWLEGRNVRHELEAALGKRVVVSNDMEAATAGEMARGVLKRISWAVFDTISTGWGGNLVLNGIRVESEPGHANVTFDSPYRCGSGHVGCLEALYSGTGMERQIAENLHLPLIPRPSPTEVWSDFTLPPIASSIGRWGCSTIGGGVGRAWANVLNRIRPLQAIVYMGATAESLLPIPRVQEKLRQTMQRICMYPEHGAPEFPILPAQEKNRAIYGAVIVYDEVTQTPGSCR